MMILDLNLIFIHNNYCTYLQNIVHGDFSIPSITLFRRDNKTNISKPESQEDTPMNPITNNQSDQEFIQDVIFVKETIKNLEDSVYRYYPKQYSAILPMLHRAYDNMALIMYRISK